MPEKRLEIPFCRPKPIPKPMAPPKTAKRERSMPADVIPMRSAQTMRLMRVILEIRTCDERLRDSMVLILRSVKAAASPAKYTRAKTSSKLLMTARAERRKSPMEKAKVSRAVVV